MNSCNNFCGLFHGGFVKNIPHKLQQIFRNKSTYSFVTPYVFPLGIPGFGLSLTECSWSWFVFRHLSPSSETCCTALGVISVLSHFWLVKVLDCLCCGLLCAFVKCKVFGSHQADKCSTNAVVLPPGIAALRVWLFCSHTCGADKSCRIWVGSMQMLLSPRMSLDPAGFRFWPMPRRDFQESQSIVWISALGRLHESKW